MRGGAAVALLLCLLLILDAGAHVSAQRQAAPPPIPLTATLTPAESSVWRSANGTFALGFFPVTSPAPVAGDRFVLGLWYGHAPPGPGGGPLPLTVVWTANRQQPVDRGALLRFDGGNLVLYGSVGETVWETGTAAQRVSGAELLDTGNLRLLRAASNASSSSSSGYVAWQSFDDPTDTLVPGQVLRRPASLRAWTAAPPQGGNSSRYGQPAAGVYAARFRSNGTLALVWNASVTYLSTLAGAGAGGDGNLYLNATRGSRLSPTTAALDRDGRFVMQDKNGREVFSWTATDAYSAARPLRRLTLDADGNLRMYSSYDNGILWRAVWAAVQDVCRVYGVCGVNGLCRRASASGGGGPSCSCPPGFRAFNFSASQPCASVYPLQQDDAACQPQQAAMALVDNATLVGAGGASAPFAAASYAACADRCVAACACRGAVYSAATGTCLLYEARFLAVAGTDAAAATTTAGLKVNRLELPQPPGPPPPTAPPNVPSGPPPFARRRGVRKDLKVAGIAIGGTAGGLAALVIFLACGCCWVKKHKQRKRTRKVGATTGGASTPQQQQQHAAMTMRGVNGSTTPVAAAVAAKPWTYKELRRATKSFDQPLGDGRFGPLFKGVLPDGTVVAVRILRKPLPAAAVVEPDPFSGPVSQEMMDGLLLRPQQPPPPTEGGVRRTTAEDEKVLLPRDVSRSSSRSSGGGGGGSKDGKASNRFRSRSLGVGFFNRSRGGGGGDGSGPQQQQQQDLEDGAAPPPDTTTTASAAPSRKLSAAFASLFSGRSVMQSFSGYGRSGELGRGVPYHSGELSRGGSHDATPGGLSRAASRRLPPDSIFYDPSNSAGMSAFEEEQQFRARVDDLGRVSHPNLVRLAGYCIEGRRRLLVHHFVENGSVAKFLFHRKGYTIFDWATRLDTALAAARGLAHLHDACSPPLVHADLRPESIVLDAQFKARVTDFGLLHLVLGADRAAILAYMTRAGGGRHLYLAPEWAAGLPVTPKVDVYSFGLVLLELVSGRRCFQPPPPGSTAGAHQHAWNFPAWAFVQMEAGRLPALADPALAGALDQQQLERVVRTAFWCVQDEADSRPSMAVVLLMLQGEARIPAPVPPPRLIQGLQLPPGQGHGTGGVDSPATAAALFSVPPAIAAAAASSGGGGLYNSV